MPKVLLATCLLSLLIFPGCSCNTKLGTVNYDPFDNRTMAEKEAMDEEDAAWEAANEDRKEQLNRPSAVYP